MMKPKVPGIDGPGCSEGGMRLEEAAQTGFTSHAEGQVADDAGRQDVNETFLLHGLPKAVVMDIVQNGFDERYAGANKGTLFGAGS